MKEHFKILEIDGKPVVEKPVKPEEQIIIISTEEAPPKEPIPYFKILSIEDSKPIETDPHKRKIVCCISNSTTPGVFEKERNENPKFFSGKNVLYNAPPDHLEKEYITNGGMSTYYISQINTENKFSLGYFNCTGLAVVGYDSDREENISFLSHQNPRCFELDRKDKFLQDLKEEMLLLKDECSGGNGNVDIVLFGGRTVLVEEGEVPYNEIKEILIKLCVDVLGISPHVIPPKKDTVRKSNGKNFPEEVFFNTRERRLFINRPGEVAYTEKV